MTIREDKTVDIAVVGGSAAGVAAGLQLGRIRRRVVVIDSGEPRNAPAAHMHGFPGFDGVSPADFLVRANGELSQYGVEVFGDRVESISRQGDGRFTLVTWEGRTLKARRVLLATGLTDLLPDVPGVKEQWGSGVIHCPWCHGYEVRGQRIAVIDTSGLGSHQALLFSQLSTNVTLIEQHGSVTSDHDRRRLSAAGVSIEARQVKAVDAVGDHLRLTLADRTAVDVDVVAVAPRFQPNVSMVEPLNIAVAEHPSGMGSHVAVTEAGQTSEPGVYAAGNVVDPMQQVLHAAADGSRVAIAINADLFEEDLLQKAS